MQHATQRVCNVAVRSSAWSSSGLPAEQTVRSAVRSCGLFLVRPTRVTIRVVYCPLGYRPAYNKNWLYAGPSSIGKFVTVTKFYVKIYKNSKL